MFRKINVKEELLKERDRTGGAGTQQELMDEVRALLAQAKESDAELVSRLRKGKPRHEVVKPVDVKDGENIFTLEQVKNVCVNYRLRFLDSKQYKGDYPYEALIKVREFELRNNIQVQQFNIMAPAKMFRLIDPDKDPLLFANIGGNRYVLIHQWGDDLAWHRKLLTWPVKSLRNLLLTIVFIALVIAIFLPLEMPVNRSVVPEDRLVHGPGYMYMVRSFLFLLTFLAIGSLTLRQFLRGNHNLSEFDWNNRFLY